MRRSSVILYVFAFASLAASGPAAQAAENPALCLAIARNYNNCVSAQSRPQHWGGGWGGDRGDHLEGYYGGHHGGYDDDRGYRTGGYGRGYEGYGGGHDGYGGHGGGYDGYDDEYRHYRRAARRQRAQAQCDAWLAQMQANGCM